MADTAPDPRYRPGAPDLHDLAHKAMRGHQMVADSHRIHAHGQAAELETRRAAIAPPSAPESGPPRPGHDDTPGTH